MRESQISDLVVRKSSHDLATIGEKDVFSLAGRRKGRAEIQDFSASVSHWRTGYESMIVPAWVRGNPESQLRTSFAMLDSALTGDPWADFRAFYCSGGIEYPVGFEPAQCGSTGFE